LFSWHDWLNKMSNRFALRQYVGRLTPRQASAGIAAAISTARGLLKDADLLLENERWQRAAALSILAIEEVGKIVILRSILLARSEEELAAEWRSYRSHTKKNVHWIFLDLFRMGGRKLEDFMPIFDPRSNHGQYADTAKQDCFYSNISLTCEWFLPEQRIGPTLAKELFAAATMLLPNAAAPMTSEAELELWVKHLRPVWKHSMPAMKKAIAACYAEAQAKGVLPAKTNATEMLDFLNGSSNPTKL
jgi:AbiV family abortive infection protein